MQPGMENFRPQKTVSQLGLHEVGGVVGVHVLRALSTGR